MRRFAIEVSFPPYRSIVLPISRVQLDPDPESSRKLGMIGVSNDTLEVIAGNEDNVANLKGVVAHCNVESLLLHQSAIGSCR